MKVLLIVILILSLFYGCGECPIAGGSSDHGNARVAGIIVDQDGEPLVNARVELYPEDYNHVTDSLQVTPYTTTTDEQGFYIFDSVKYGSFTISGTSENGGNGFVKNLGKIQASILEDTIKSCPFGYISVKFDSLHLKKGDILFFPGLRRYRVINDESDIGISQIPKGSIQLKGYDAIMRTTIELGKAFSFEIIPGRILILPSSSPVPFCMRNDSIITCSMGITDEMFTFSILNPSIQVNGVLVYRISWGDGTISDWTSSKTILHSWAAEGYYPVQSQVFYNGSQYLAWSEPLYIEIIKH